MIPVLVSVDRAGDLKLGARKCRLYKKDEVVKVAKKYGISTDKKTVSELCSAIRSRAKSSPMNNTPLAKLYPEAAKKRTAAKKRVEKKALNKKIAANFIKAMTTKIASPVRTPKPSKKAKPLTKDEAIKRIGAMKGIKEYEKGILVNRIERGTMSPRRVVKVAREVSRLNAPAYRIRI
tara:strand:+ start:178 stop:711 length:534 start_codon:yes stop_codon:yes gene_type:complete